MLPLSSQVSDPTRGRETGKLQRWKKELDAAVSAPAVDFSAATATCLEICREERDSVLGVQACRAYAALRRSQVEGASEFLVRASLREVEAVRFAILEAQRPPFGKANSGSCLILERRLLNLPIAGPLTAKEINAAFRACAHDAHPDHGGAPERFLALSAAREALLREAD